jgi:CTP:molybdopterin cytidylyltransferase MocA
VIVAVILAAGRGERLGGVAKALLRGEDGRTFLSAIAASIDRAVVVVAPPFGDDVAAAARGLDLDVVINDAPERGMASSVALGFERAAALFDGAEGALLWPVDCGGVAAATVSALVSGRAQIAVPVFDGRGGHPTWFGRAVWDELIACGAAPDGARAVLRRDPSRVARIDVPDPAVTRDVDSPGDLA